MKKLAFQIDQYQTIAGKIISLEEKEIKIFAYTYIHIHIITYYYYLRYVLNTYEDLVNRVAYFTNGSMENITVLSELFKFPSIQEKLGIYFPLAGET